MFAHEATEHAHPDRDEIGHRIIGVAKRVDAFGEVVERALCQGVHEQPILGPEQAVHGAGGGTGLVGDGPDRERRDPAVGDESLGGRAQRCPGVLVMLSWPAHLDIIALHVTLNVT